MKQSLRESIDIKIIEPNKHQWCYQFIGSLEFQAKQLLDARLSSPHIVSEVKENLKEVIIRGIFKDSLRKIYELKHLCMHQCRDMGNIADMGRMFKELEDIVQGNVREFPNRQAAQ